MSRSIVEAAEPKRRIMRRYVSRGIRIRNKPPLTEEQREMANQYVPLAYKLALPYIRKWPNEENELLSASMYGLVIAAATFNPGKDKKFGSWAYTKIGFALRNVFLEIRNLSGYKQCSNLTSVDGDNFDIVSTKSFLTDFENREFVEYYIGLLPSRYHDVMRCVYIDGLSQFEAGIRLGISKSVVGEIHGVSIRIISQLHLVDKQASCDSPEGGDLSSRSSLT